MNEILFSKYTYGKYSHTLEPGAYLFECWGAQGGTGLCEGNLNGLGGGGAYVSGRLILRKTTTFYFFIGGKGQDGVFETNKAAEGGFNGGGKGGMDLKDHDGTGGGGGATDVRLVDGEFDTPASLYSRIMVAAGGGGGTYASRGNPGGLLTGLVLESERGKFKPSETNQTSGNKLLIGGDGSPHLNFPSGGGGGGYYGGNSYNSSETRPQVWYSIPSGGSSYVSGLNGCNSMNDKGEHTGKNIHPSGYFFDNIIAFSGDKCFSSPQGSSEYGHNGDGAVKISRLEFRDIHCYTLKPGPVLNYGQFLTHFKFIEFITNY